MNRIDLTALAALLQRHAQALWTVGVVLLVLIAGAAVVWQRKPAPESVVPSPAAPAAVAVQPPPVVGAGFGEPLPGFAVVSPFGLRQLPWEAKGRLHAGVDIAAPTGSVVRAIAAGVVTRTGADSGYGRYVELMHPGGVTSFYAHLGAVDPSASVGASLAAGSPIGVVGVTGSSTGAHLHFEMRNGAHRPLDPAFFIGKAFATAEEWPLDAAAKISPIVRIAVVSNIPESKRELMILMEEQRADEAATVEFAALLAAAAADAAEAPLDEATAAEPPVAAAEEPSAAESPKADEPAAKAAPAPTAEAPPAPEPVQRRPATPPRLPMPD